MGPEATLAWLDAALAGEMPANRTLLLRLRRLAIMGAVSRAGQTASTAARNRYWQRTFDQCRRFPGVKSDHEAAKWAADLVKANRNTLRAKPWIKKRKS